MVERAMQFEKKEEIGAGMMPEQVGIAVSGGITMVTASMEAFLRNGAVKRGEQRAEKGPSGSGFVGREGQSQSWQEASGQTTAAQQGVARVVANGLLTERASARLRRQEWGTSIGTPLLASYISLSCIFA